MTVVFLTSINFRGKDFVFNHHLSIPFHPLEIHKESSISDPSLDGNMIIQGDNLIALKALMPYYSNRIDCIFIDPPYNTGTEKWCYNDNVNSPVIKEWIGKVVAADDTLKSDKWCAMMYPRLKLLYDLLADDGSLWVTIDDNEVHHCKLILNEIFGEEAFVACICWQSRYSVSNDATISNSHNYILVYSKNSSTWAKLRNKLPKNEEQQARYKNPDDDKNGPWRVIPWDAAEERDENLAYPITTPKGTQRYPPKGRHWSGTRERWDSLVEQGLDYYGENQDGVPGYKKYLKDSGFTVPTTWWTHEETGHTGEASIELEAYKLDLKFPTPKPIRLLKRIFEIATKKDSVILDSFAGSGTTADAILKMNQMDGGQRKFILVEMEKYAENLTAERIRRVINGYKSSGRKVRLLSEKITWSTIKDHSDVLAKVKEIDDANKKSKIYDKISKTVKSGFLTVVGENKKESTITGTGGEFTYCTLGDQIQASAILSGKELPNYTQLGSVIFNQITYQTLDTEKLDEGEFYLGETNDSHVWMIYRDDLDWLKSPEAALNLSRAKEFAKHDPEKRHLVIAPARHVSQKMLDENNIRVEFVPLPYSLFRFE